MTENLYRVFRTRFADRPARPFLETEDGRVITYSDLERTTARYAQRLALLGLIKGDRLVSVLDKTPEAVFLYLACLRSGVVYVPLNTAYQAAELDYFLADADPAAIVCRPASAGILSGLAASRGIPRVLTLGADGSGSFAHGTEALGGNWAEVPVEEEDLAALLYTSGTTGRPKGAMMSHDLLAAKATTLAAHWGWRPEDVLAHAMPIFHTHGLFLSMHCVLASGASMIFLPRFDAATIVRLLPRASVFTGVPTMYARLLAQDALTREACRTMRLFLSGSAPLPPDIFRAFQARTGHAILECWGMTETLTNASNPLQGERRAGSVGLPAPGVTIRVVDDRGLLRPAGEAGMLEVRPTRPFLGYWRRPAETRARFRPDGFFVTGDIGRLAADGYLAIVGRATDLIISGGYNIDPAEVETLLDRLDGVAESAVIGLPHPDLGEAVTAVVERAPGRRDMDEASIIAELKRGLASFKVPKRVIAVPELPRNSVGKVQKAALRERFKNVYQGGG
jgi:malonyl-CoA/methylmalonyl-CoA synthetase